MEIDFVLLLSLQVLFLTNAAYDPKSKVPEFKVCAVRIDKPGGERGAGRKRMERRGLART